MEHKTFLLVSGEMRSPRPDYCLSSSLELLKYQC